MNCVEIVLVCQVVFKDSYTQHTSNTVHERFIQHKFILFQCYVATVRYSNLHTNAQHQKWVLNYFIQYFCEVVIEFGQNELLHKHHNTIAFQIIRCNRIRLQISPRFWALPSLPWDAINCIKFQIFISVWLTLLSQLWTPARWKNRRSEGKLQGVKR